MTATRNSRPPTPRRRPATALPAVAILAGLLAAGVLALSDDPPSSRSPSITAVRVTSGSESATGFAVGRGRVVTVAHVVDGAVKRVGTNGAVENGGTDRALTLRVSGVSARVLRIDRRSDLALLAVQGIGARSAALTEAGAGDEVRLLRLRDGRSSSLSVHVRRAIVAHVLAPGAVHAVTRPALELRARVRPGDSGAPVLSRSGALAGVIFATSSRREDTAYAVDASAVARVLARR